MRGLRALGPIRALDRLWDRTTWSEFVDSAGFLTRLLDFESANPADFRQFGSSWPGEKASIERALSASRRLQGLHILRGRVAEFGEVAFADGLDVGQGAADPQRAGPSFDERRQRFQIDAASGLP